MFSGSLLFSPAAHSVPHGTTDTHLAVALLSLASPGNISAIEV